MSLLRITAIVFAALVTACASPTDDGDALRVEIERLGASVPPDTLEFEDPYDWYDYPPIVEISGGAESIIVAGDYTLSCASAEFTGEAEVVDGRVTLIIGHECPPKRDEGAPKLDFRATVSPLEPGPIEVVVRYDIWHSQSFGGYPVGIREVARDTVEVE